MPGVVGIGLDLVELDEFAAMLQRRGPKLLERVFTLDEIAYCQARHTPAQSFAARFAAKEAAFKALGTGWDRGVDWREVEVVGTPPALKAHGTFARLALELGAKKFFVTLTHTTRYASAVVVLSA